MKIQCNCGTKYAFDATPEMAAHPIQFICQNCGADNSVAVNMLIQQQFPAEAAQRPRPAAVAVAVSSVPTAQSPVPPAPAPPVETGSRLRVQTHAPEPAAPVAPAAEGTAPAPAAPQMCRKHPGHFTADQCRVCGKPICLQCMSLFGYVCSALCKTNAEERGIELPVYENQFGTATRRHTRKLGRIIYGTLGGLALFIGIYVWYLTSWSQPRVVFSQTFGTAGYNGGGKLYEREAVILHGGHLARYDWKDKKKIWGVDLINASEVSMKVDEALAQQEADMVEWRKNRTGFEVSAPERYNREDFTKRINSSMQSQFKLHVHDQNIWLRTRDKLVQYDWATGKPGKEVALNGYIERTIPSQDSLLIFAEKDGGEELMKVDWKSGETQTQPLRAKSSSLAALGGQSNALAFAQAMFNRTNAALLAAIARTNPALISLLRTNPALAAVNPALRGYKVELPAPLQQRLAAPAIAAAAVQNKRIEREMDDDDDDDDVRRPSFNFSDSGGPTFVHDNGHMVEFSVKLLERKTITRQAMKAPPKKSALEGTVNQAATVAIANEIFNEFAREATGGVEKEDASRYEVTIKRTTPNASEAKFEVVGSPDFFPLQTVDLLVAGKSLTVLDKSGKKLWNSPLNYEISGGFGENPWGGDLIANASAPGVERDGALYFFDEGVLTCFELANGNARWRHPSVGVSKILFDEKGMLYVDTTTGSADKLKFSQQIDISDKAYPIIIKIDPRTGKPLWRSQQNGRLSHVFGKLIYTMEWSGGDEDDAPTGLLKGITAPPHIRIRRLSASNGKVKWEYYQKRAPLNVDIRDNTIQLVFKKEFQVLKFLAL